MNKYITGILIFTAGMTLAPLVQIGVKAEITSFDPKTMTGTDDLVHRVPGGRIGVAGPLQFPTGPDVFTTSNSAIVFQKEADRILEVSGIALAVLPMNRWGQSDYARPDKIEDVKVFVWTKDGKKWRAQWVEDGTALPAGPALPPPLINTTLNTIPCTTKP